VIHEWGAEARRQRARWRALWLAVRGVDIGPCLTHGMEMMCLTSAATRAAEVFAPPVVPREALPATPQTAPKEAIPATR
jgi:hypothetical protein